LIIMREQILQGPKDYHVYKGPIKGKAELLVVSSWL